MGEEGIHTYLILMKPTSLKVVWVNQNVEAATVERDGESAIGRCVSDVIPFAEALGIPDRLREVAATGETRELHSTGFSVAGNSTSTSSSMYRLPSGELLLASEYVVGGVPS